MKQRIYFAAILALMGIAAFTGGVAAQNTLIYFTQGGATMTVASGGTINVATGGKFQNNGVDMDLSAGIATSTSSSTAELDTLASVVAGTVTASKAVVVGADKNLDVLAVADLKLGAGAGTSVAATAAELNRAADMSTRIVDCTASTLAVTEADHDGKIVTLNRAGGIAVTLPTPAAGMQFTFVVQTTFTGAATIKSGAGTHVMIGHAQMGNDSDNSTVLWQALAASTYDTIDLLGTSNSTGGLAGQIIKVTGLSTTRWFVEIIGDAAGTEATPFADTVA